MESVKDILQKIVMKAVMSNNPVLHCGNKDLEIMASITEDYLSQLLTEINKME